MGVEFSGHSQPIVKVFSNPHSMYMYSLDSSGVLNVAIVCFLPS